MCFTGIEKLFFYNTLACVSGFAPPALKSELRKKIPTEFKPPHFWKSVKNPLQNKKVAHVLLQSVIYLITKFLKIRLIGLDVKV